MGKNKERGIPTKPGIILLSKDEDDSFDWMSDGWYSVEARARNPEKARRLMMRALRAIKRGKDVKDACRRLEEAGFKIKRKKGGR